MNQFKEFKAIQLSWDEVSHLISCEIKKALGKAIKCDAHPDAYDYWCAAFPNYRMSVPEIHTLVGALRLTKEESFDCFPNEEEGATNVNSVGMKASETLLRHALPFEWAHYLFDDDYLWIISKHPLNPSEISLPKVDEFDFGGDDSVIAVGPKTVDISKLGYFDELEENAWELIKLHGHRFGIELKPKYQDECEGDECIDYYAAKAVVNSVLYLFKEAGVRFITSDSNSDAKFAQLTYENIDICPFCGEGCGTYMDGDDESRYRCESCGKEYYISFNTGSWSEEDGCYTVVEDVMDRHRKSYLKKENEDD